MAEYNERVAAVTTDIIHAVRDVLTRHGVDHAEYGAAVLWIRGLVEAGEVPMFLDNFFEQTVEQATYAGKPGSEGTVRGPYYLPGAPLLTDQPFVIPMRDDEPGDPMVLGGLVVDLDGKPLAGALVDLWHAGNDGTYSGFVGDAPPTNLRARLYTDGDGRFQIRTIRPSPYQIPTGGPTGRYLEMIGRHAWRPAHFHLRLSADGFDPLTTQLYFRGGPWLGDERGHGDVSEAVKESLKIEVTEDRDEEVAARYGLSIPFHSAHYTFTLRPVV
ncbi:catechol 1,2-dioxygenase [Streptomyces sp. CA-111067]|uniref:dioxygenase family protein n=1 Tax=Streptomyces sp. CA-111067 TaxID=3240046 RepID=UPI003D9982BB